MGQTVLTVQGDKFLINGKLTYSEIATSKPKSHGMLMNSRMIQGIFDSKNREQFNRFGVKFDPDTNTQQLIDALPSWYDKGLRAITVGLSGGGACFTIKGNDLLNLPYSSDGKTVDGAYLARLDKLILACDKMGIVVIVSYFYAANMHEMDGTQAIINATKTMSVFLKEKAYSNVIIEICNEYNVFSAERYPLLHNPYGIVALIDIAKEYSGGMLVGCSGAGGAMHEEVAKASDVVLFHGNGQSRGKLYNFILRTKGFANGKPLVINEDSQAVGQLEVCEELGVSWGYYNNVTKQEPPTDWTIQAGEDEYFVWRMAKMIGIEQADMPKEKQYHLHGFEPLIHHEGKRFPRLASLYPETINFVRFYENDKLVYTAYDESFSVNYRANWQQIPVQTKNGDVWKAEVNLVGGEVITFTETVNNA